MTKQATPAESRKPAAKRTFQDILGTLRQGKVEELDAVDEGKLTLEGKKIAELLDKNFDILDPDDNGITKEELTGALLSAGRFSKDEYVMLKLVSKYFDTIANMCNDQIGPETVITKTDKDVLCQFLIHSHISLEQLHEWRALDTEPELDL